MTDTNWLPDLSGREGPKFRALAAALREAARSGMLPPGTRLPAMRDLAWRLGVTPGTVARAYQIAAAEGVLDSHVGRGSFVAESHPVLKPLILERVPGREDPLCGPADLRATDLPDCGQVQAIADAMHKAAGQMSASLLDYPSLTRDRECRQALLPWLARRVSGVLGADDVVLSHGGHNAMSLVMSLCLTGERPRVICEALAYPGLRKLARHQRAEVLGAEMDDQGMLPDALDHLARTTGARLVCLAPSAQNPTAACMGPDRRAQIIAVARRHDLQIVEDDCFAGPSAHIPALRAMAPERVWHVSSLSKVFAAGLRFGAIICPTGMGETGRLAAQHSFFGMALPMTAMVTELLTSGQVAQLAAKVQSVFDDRVALAQQVMDGMDFTCQPGVPFLWLRLPPGWTAPAFLRQAADQGVLLRSADEFAIAAPGQAVPNAVRIALDGQMPRDRLRVALGRLRRLCDAPPGDLPV